MAKTVTSLHTYARKIKFYD